MITTRGIKKGKIFGAEIRDQEKDDGGRNWKKNEEEEGVRKMIPGTRSMKEKQRKFGHQRRNQSDQGIITKKLSIKKEAGGGREVITHLDDSKGKATSTPNRGGHIHEKKTDKKEASNRGG